MVMKKNKLARLLLLVGGEMEFQIRKKAKAQANTEKQYDAVFVSAI